MTSRDVLKERFRLLLGEAAAGVGESMHRVVAASYSLGVKYSIPEAIEFFNALEDPTKVPEWLDYLPEEVECEFPVREKCFDCFYVRLCAASAAEGVTREALLMDAYEYMPEDFRTKPEWGIGLLMDAADSYRELKDLEA